MKKEKIKVLKVKGCECRDKKNCPHEYPKFVNGKLINPMKCGAISTDIFGNEE